MKYVSLLPLIAAGFVTACGGGEDSLDDLQDTADLLYLRIDRMDATLANDMPTTGSARYEGVGAYSGTISAENPDALLENPDSYSNVDVDVNFGSGQVTGRAYNFKSAVDDSVMNGVININGSVSGNTVVGTFSGNIEQTIDTDDVSFSANVAYNGMVAGGFAGDNADALAGMVVGVGTVSGESIPINGLFAGER